MVRNFSFYGVMIAAALVLQLGFGGRAGAIWVPYPARAGEPIEVQIGVGVGIGLLVVLLSRLGSAWLDWASRLDAWFRDVLGPLSGRDIFAMAALSAIAEEAFFRGFLQPRLGLTATAILFGVVHFPFERRLIPWTVAATGMGFVFGWMVEMYGTLMPAVLAHFTVNYFNLHVLTRPLAAEAR
ncbi:MAG: CPBP family glutamic-type intramembrane protease [bacterium]